MNKVICDICGTQYPDTAAQCPICGYAREIAGQPRSAGNPVRQVPARSGSGRSKGGRFAASNVRRRNQEAEAYPTRQPRQQKHSEGHYDRAQPESNGFLVVILVIVIMTLLATTAFIFFEYFLPNALSSEPAPSTESTEATPESTDPPADDSIPCEALVLTSGGTIEFTAAGEMSLLNVVIVPSDSTDELTYSSSDDSVAAVNAEGRVTAVSEGEAVITITCGKREMQCNVICAFVPDEPETKGMEEATTAEETD